MVFKRSKSEIEMISKDQDDWSEIESKTRTAVFGKLQVAMEVPRGTHFFRISLINYTSNIDWCNYSPPIEYTIITTYQLVDEGEELNLINITEPTRQGMISFAEF